MNDISDIALLIAVIALALWPIALFGLNILNKQKKRLKHLEQLTKNELDDIKTQDLVSNTLKKIGCQPALNEDGNIRFKYQGDDFYIAAEEGNRFIMIWNPWWGSISIDNEAFPYLKEIINLVNINSMITTVYMADEDGKTVGLHSRCHTFFSPNEGELVEHMQMLLDQFFDVHNAIKDNLNQFGKSTGNEKGKTERIQVKGFSAYKDNSEPIEPQKEKQNP